MIKTIHTSRTMMFAELSKVMAYGLQSGSFNLALTENVTGKLSKSSQLKTTKYLQQLYGFDMANENFAALAWFWKSAPEQDRPLITILYAIKYDHLLAESTTTVHQTPVGKKAAIEAFEANLETYHPNKFTPATRKSVAQNIASSWKQAGFLLGKVRNIRVNPEIDYWVVSFAILLGYLDGHRGEFLLNTVFIKALALPQATLHDRLVEAAQRDLIQYQHSGHITTIMVPYLLQTINIHG